MKVGQNRGLTARLVAIGVLQCDCVKTENDLSNKKTLFRPLPQPQNVTIDLFFSDFLEIFSELTIWIACM